MSVDPRNVVEWIARLVAVDTTSARSNLPLIEDVANYLDGHGFEVRLIADAAGDKANLFATIGPPIDGGIVLSGHSDTVPVAGQPWHSDPFAMREDAGRLYGRGTTDMKGFIAAVMALAPELAGEALATPVHIALSYDEEVGCVGVRPMIDAIRDSLPRPRLVIVGEPTDMRVVGAHKGISQQTTRVVGRDGHSSRPAAGVNAVAYAAEIIAFLNRLSGELGATPHTDGRFDPPGTTFNVGTIEGGTAVNIIARECHFRWEFRPVPGIDPGAVLARIDAFVAQDILPRMRAVDADSDVITTCDVAAPTLEAPSDSPAIALAFQLTGQNDAATVSYVCEAGLFAEAGIPAVVCGPGSIDQAHQPNEFVTLEQIAACSDFLQRLLRRARAGI